MYRKKPSRETSSTATFNVALSRDKLPTPKDAVWRCSWNLQALSGDLWRGQGQCAQLRYACEHKDELGLEGAGTCRRYRATCG